MIDRLRREGLKVLVHTTLPKLVGTTTAARRPAVTAEIERLIRAADLDGVIDAVRAMAERRDSQPLLPGIACPTLILSGAEDALIAPQESSAMAQVIPGAELDIIPEAGHLLNLERPEMFRGIVMPWIQRVAEAAKSRGRC